MRANWSFAAATGLLPEVGAAMVVADPFGKRVGSGGSTLYCLMRVIEAEIPPQRRASQRLDFDGADAARAADLDPARRRRLPPRAGLWALRQDFFARPRGSSRPRHLDAFDRLYPIFRDLPRGQEGAGQVVVAAATPSCFLIFRLSVLTGRG